MTDAAPLMHLAEFNVARAIAPLDDPRMAEFVAALEAINRVAESAPGFVWRLTTDDGAPSSYLAVDDDPLLVVNMSVWTSVEALAAYAYRSEHARFYRDRRRWFEPPTASPFVLWWIPAGERPTLDEGRRRLRMLHEHGPTPEAFTFKQTFPPDTSGV